MAPTLVARLDAYAQERRWSRGIAIEALVEEGLLRAEKEAGHDSKTAPRPR